MRIVLGYRQNTMLNLTQVYENRGRGHAGGGYSHNPTRTNPLGNLEHKVKSDVNYIEDKYLTYLTYDHCLSTITPLFCLP